MRLSSGVISASGLGAACTGASSGPSFNAFVAGTAWESVAASTRSSGARGLLLSLPTKPPRARAGTSKPAALSRAKPTPKVPRLDAV